MANCKISEAIFQTFRALTGEARQVQSGESGHTLSWSEAMFLNSLQSNPLANVSRIAEQLSLTKGAVTQTYQKLHQKGLIEAFQRKDNKKEKYFRFTPVGEAVWQEHQQHYARANRKLCDYFSTLNENEVRAVLRFLDTVAECIPFSQFACLCHGPAEEGGDEACPVCSRLPGFSPKAAENRF